jgi:hypothetical protein
MDVERANQCLASTVDGAVEALGDRGKAWCRLSPDDYLEVGARQTRDHLTMGNQDTSNCGNSKPKGDQIRPRIPRHVPSLSTRGSHPPDRKSLARR